MNEHVCSVEECGWSCCIDCELGPVHTIHSVDGDYDDQSCNCDGHQ